LVPELAITEITDGDVASVVALWGQCGLTRPWNDPFEDIAMARRSPNATVLVGRADGRIVASVMVGHDGHRGAVYYVSVAPEQRGAGLGRAIMAAAEAWLCEHGAPKLNLIVRGDNEVATGFYRALGYAPTSNIQLEKWLKQSQAPEN
jgi:ribosomal protein S18 acetylase RimI-like enzyme